MTPICLYLSRDQRLKNITLGSIKGRREGELGGKNNFRSIENTLKKGENNIEGGRKEDVRREKSFS